MLKKNVKYRDLTVVDSEEYRKASERSPPFYDRKKRKMYLYAYTFRLFLLEKLREDNILQIESGNARMLSTQEQHRRIIREQRRKEDNEFIVSNQTPKFQTFQTFQTFQIFQTGQEGGAEGGAYALYPYPQRESERESEGNLSLHYESKFIFNLGFLDDLVNTMDELNRMYNKNYAESHRRVLLNYFTEKTEITQMNKALKLCFENHPKTPKIGEYKEIYTLGVSLEQARVFNNVNNNERKQ